MKVKREKQKKSQICLARDIFYKNKTLVVVGGGGSLLVVSVVFTFSHSNFLKFLVLWGLWCVVWNGGVIIFELV